MKNPKAGNQKAKLLIGWATRDVTPPRPVLLHGQFYARVSEGVMDPLTTTALALESVRGGRSAGHVILASLDCCMVSDDLLAAVRQRVKALAPKIDPQAILLSATHTHTGPNNVARDPQTIGSLPPVNGLRERDLGIMERREYLDFAAGRIAAAVADAWRLRAPGGIGYGVGHAVVGLNRRVSYFTGDTRMYGQTNDPEFSHIEGHEDHAVNLLCTWDARRRLTGMLVNVACPSQVSEHQFQVSADYWHDTRLELRRRLGRKLFILPQCSAAGDLSPHVQVGKDAEKRMLELSRRTLRQELAVRIADAVTAALPAIRREVLWDAPLAHRLERIRLPLRRITRPEMLSARGEAEVAYARYEKELQELAAHPEKKQQPRWYVAVTQAYCRHLWNHDVERRFRAQARQKTAPAELHLVRLGPVAFASNPYEYYLDFGMQIKVRAPAVQTFVAQLTGGGATAYLATQRSATGRSYGAVPASTVIGPEGGRLVAQRSVEVLAGLFAKSAKRG